MRYLISFLILLFSSNALFSQAENDTASKAPTLSPQEIKKLPQREVRSFCSPIIHIIVAPPEVITFHNISHENASLLGGLPTYPFHFQNVNQRANTVAGVLSMDGERPSILGSRREGTAYYIDQVRVLEGFLPQVVE